MSKYTIIEEELESPALYTVNSSVMPSGRKDRIVITCIMFDVPIVVESAIFYKADRVHLIRTSKNHRGKGGEMYTQFFKEAKGQIEERAKAQVIEHDANVYDYHAMMRTVLEIVNGETEDTGGIMDVYVNISSGTTEYSAAAMLVCMQYKDLTAFTVRTNEYMLSNEDVKRLLYRDGRPVGFSASVEEPKMVVTFDPEKKDADLIACLGVIKEIKSRKQRDIHFEDIIKQLNAIGAWHYEPRKDSCKTDDAQKRRMNLKRNYIMPLLDKGWIKEDPLVRNRWDVTKAGEAIIEVYHGLE